MTELVIQLALAANEALFRQNRVTKQVYEGVRQRLLTQGGGEK